MQFGWTVLSETGTAAICASASAVHNDLYSHILAARYSRIRSHSSHNASVAQWWPMFMALAVAECLDWSAGLPRSKLKRVACLEKRAAALGKTIVSIDKDLRVAFMAKLWPRLAHWMSNACLCNCQHTSIVSSQFGNRYKKIRVR